MADIEHAPLLSSNASTSGDHISNYGSDGSEYTKTISTHGVPVASNKRQIGWLSAFIIVISRVIGSGIFAMPGVILREIPSPGITLLLWVVGALIAWSALVIDMEFGCMFPRSGGIKVYLEQSFPKPLFLASTMVAVQAVLLGFTATNCIVFAKYTLFATQAEINNFNTKSLAIGVLTFVTVVHGVSYKAGVAIQNALGWFKVLLLFAMLFISLFVVVFQKHTGLAEDTTGPNLPNFGDDDSWTIGTLVTATLNIFYSYAGLGNLNNVLSEVKNPVRTLKQVGPIALLTACSFYVLINVAYLLVVPLSEIRQGQELISALFFQKIFGHGFASVALPIAVALSAAGNVMVVVFSLARINQEVAREGFLPYGHILGSSKPFGTPLGGLIVHYWPSFFVIVLPSSEIVYSFIANTETYAGQFFGVATAVGLIVLRYRQPDLPRPFTAWLPAVALRLLLAIGLIVAPWYSILVAKKSSLMEEAYVLVAIALLLVGVIYWYVWTKLLPKMGNYTLVHAVTTHEESVPVMRLIKQRKIEASEV